MKIENINKLIASTLYVTKVTQDSKSRSPNKSELTQTISVDAADIKNKQSDLIQNDGR